MALLIDIPPEKEDEYLSRHYILRFDTGTIILEKKAEYTKEKEVEVHILYHACTQAVITLLESIHIRLLFDAGYHRLTFRMGHIYSDQGVVLSKTTELSSGTYGTIHHFLHLNLAVKVFNKKHDFSHVNEVAILEMIKYAYPNPESKGLARIIAHGDNYIVFPFYTRILRFSEADHLYNGLGVAIHNLHMLGIIHRDIKPSNVMVHAGKVILIDFGAASWHIVSNLRQRSSSIQTMYFRAPEVALDRKRLKHFTYAIDWWSYGFILASKHGYLYTPDSNNNLLIELTKLFGVKSLDNLKNSENSSEDIIPKNVPGKIANFLNLNPKKRLSIREYLSLPEINLSKDKYMIWEGIHIHNSAQTFITKEIITRCQGWASYFACLDFLRIMTLGDAILLALLAYDGKVGHVDYYRLQRIVKGKVYRLNTFSILLLKHPTKVLQFIPPCFVLSLHGNYFPHQEQADWVEQGLFSVPSDDHPITKKYRELLPLAKAFDTTMYNTLLVSPYSSNSK